MTRIGNNRVGPLGAEVQQPTTAQAKAKAPVKQRDSFERGGSAPQEQQASGFASKLQQHIEKGGVLTKDQSGEAVVELQQLLNLAGAEPPLRLDAAFGSLTEMALQRFQRRSRAALYSLRSRRAISRRYTGNAEGLLNEFDIEEQLRQAIRKLARALRGSLRHPLNCGVELAGNRLRCLLSKHGKSCRMQRYGRR